MSLAKMRMVCEHTFTDETPIEEPIEIRLWNERLMNRNDRKVLSAHVAGNGMISHSLSTNGTGVPEALSNLQVKGVFPKKAVPGWQGEFIAAAATGLYDVVEVR